MSDGDPVVRVSFPATEEYFIEAWERRPQYRSRWSRPIVVVTVTLVVCAAVGITQFVNGDRRWWFAIPVGLCTMGVMWYQQNPSGQRRHAKKLFRHQITNPPAQNIFEFRADGFRSTGQLGTTSFHPWTTVPYVLQHADGLVLYPNDDVYFWLPEKVFASAADYRAVVELMSGKVSGFRRLKN